METGFSAPALPSPSPPIRFSLSPGPDGLSFINFRAGRPGDIRFANGPAMNEPAYWQARLPRPEYLEPA